MGSPDKLRAYFAGDRLGARFRDEAMPSHLHRWKSINTFKTSEKKRKKKEIITVRSAWWWSVQRLRPPTTTRAWREEVKLSLWIFGSGVADFFLFFGGKRIEGGRNGDWEWDEQKQRKWVEGGPPVDSVSVLSLAESVMTIPGTVRAEREVKDNGKDGHLSLSSSLPSSSDLSSSGERYFCGSLS